MAGIDTSRPHGRDRGALTREVAAFWDRTSDAWRTLWGPHLHHGYFETGGEAPLAAQEKLLEKLLTVMKLAPGGSLLDAGCGMGATSLYLAQNCGVNVTGVTLSRRQAEIAAALAARERVQNVSFRVEDALSLGSFSDETFDVVWSLESCEQFFDKPLFLRQAFRVLKPGGQLLLATWCSGADILDGAKARQYRRICSSLRVAYMPTISTYIRMLEESRFALHTALDWSANVKESWAAGLRNIGGYSLLAVIRASGWRGLLAGNPVKLMQAAYDSGLMRYGVFVASKPDGKGVATPS